MATRVQILGEAICISYNANTLGKGMHPTILHPPSCGKIAVQTGLFKPWYGN